MKEIFKLFIPLIFLSCAATKQPLPVPVLKALPIPLTKELADPNKQFSGLFISSGQLWLLPECRLNDGHEAVLYKIPLTSLDSALIQTVDSIGGNKIPVKGLDYLQHKMERLGQGYEGLEAMVINDTAIYISVETDTSSSLVFLIKGNLFNDHIDLDTSILFSIPKPLKNGRRIYNASFEALSLYQQRLYAVFEYNNFPGGSYIYITNGSLKGTLDSIKVDPVPFRISDISFINKHYAAAINYFYNGSGGDADYRPAREESAYSLVTNNSEFYSYNRLIDLDFSKSPVSWSVVGEMPKTYWQYNWEGLAAYKKGYFLINDKFTGERPFRTVLLFVKR